MLNLKYVFAGFVGALVSSSATAELCPDDPREMSAEIKAEIDRISTRASIKEGWAAALVELDSIEQNDLNCRERTEVFRVRHHMLLKLDKFVEADELLQNALALGYAEPPLNSYLIETSYAQLKSLHYESALSTVLKITESQENDRQALHQVATIHFVKGDYDQAADILRQIVDLDGSAQRRETLRFLWLTYKLMDDRKGVREVKRIARKNNVRLRLPGRNYVLPQPGDGTYNEAEATQFGTLNYPSKAFNSGLEGACEAWFSIDVFGWPFDIETVCTDDIFVEPAIGFIEGSRFTPQSVNGMPTVRVNVVRPFKFTISY